MLELVYVVFSKFSHPVGDYRPVNRAGIKNKFFASLPNSNCIVRISLQTSVPSLPTYMIIAKAKPRIVLTTHAWWLTKCSFAHFSSN
jgi:hypothetical protein